MQVLNFILFFKEEEEKIQQVSDSMARLGCDAQMMSPALPPSLMPAMMMKKMNSKSKTPTRSWSGKSRKASRNVSRNASLLDTI